jgi:cyanophycinase
VRSFALLGSGEFEPWSEEVDRWMLRRAAHPDGPVLILPTASAPEGDEVFTMWGDMGLRHFDAMGVSAHVLPLKTRADAESPEVVSKLEGASMVYFSGGNPAYLVEVLLGSPFWRGVLSKLDRGLAYAGCSAGISSLGVKAPDSGAGGLAQEAWRPGLGLFPNVVFGPHWDMLDSYIPGLPQLMEEAVPAGGVLFAVDERTAAIGDGHEWGVVGLGKARVHRDGEWHEWPAGATFLADVLP